MGQGRLLVAALAAVNVRDRATNGLGYVSSAIAWRL
jgi:hypothetical protein